ncbi:MAG: glycosyltransferase N-terminal domain-containing protein [Acetobacter cibinongensis]
MQFALRTTRWTFYVTPEAFPLLIGRNGTNGIVAFWHEILPATPVLCLWAKNATPSLRVKVLISRNRDGRMIADIIAPWGIGTIAGSSDTRGKNKGGAAAFRQMRKALLAGEQVVITPDGPRGPRRMAQPGMAALAAAVRKPVVPVGAYYSGLQLNSWDKMVIPLPFGKGRFVCGTPIEIGKNNPDGTGLLAETLTQQMREVTDGPDTTREAYHVFQWAMPSQSIAPSKIWACVATLIAPSLPFLLRSRQRQGKELPDRVREKMGFASRARPKGKLVWFHAASVGEVLSILPLIAAWLEKGAGSTALVTTGSVTGARIVAQYQANHAENTRLIHQFVPLDVPRWGKRFLEYWSPHAVVFTESELWPNLIGQCRAHQIPMALVNGRMSASSFKAWQKAPRVAKRLMASFSWIAPRSEADASHFKALGCNSLEPTGDIKAYAQPLPVNEQSLKTLQRHIGQRPVFLAASTHSGEDETILQAAALARKTVPDLLTLIVPRHPERGADISALASGAPRRSLNEWPQGSDTLWICDTLGELGLFYTLATCAFIGNSLPSAQNGGGGHNPFEPIKLGCVASTGPRTHNFSEIFQKLETVVPVLTTKNDIAEWVVSQVAEPGRRAVQVKLAQDIIQQHANQLDSLAKKIMMLGTA